MGNGLTQLTTDLTADARTQTHAVIRHLLGTLESVGQAADQAQILHGTDASLVIEWENCASRVGSSGYLECLHMRDSASALATIATSDMRHALRQMLHSNEKQVREAEDRLADIEQTLQTRRGAIHRRHREASEVRMRQSIQEHDNPSSEPTPGCVACALTFAGTGVAATFIAGVLRSDTVAVYTLVIGVLAAVAAGVLVSRAEGRRETRRRADQSKSLAEAQIREISDLERQAQDAAAVVQQHLAAAQAASQRAEAALRSLTSG